MTHRPILLLALLTLAPAFARAATIQTLDPTPLFGTLTTIDDNTLTFAPKPTVTKKISLPDIIDITISPLDRQLATIPPSTQPTTAASTQPKPILWRTELTNGDHLAASLSDWSAGHLTCRLDVLKGAPLTIPVNNLSAIWSDATFDAHILLKKAKDLHLNATTQDIAYVQKEGEVRPVSGLVTGLDDHALHFKFEGEEHTIKLERLIGIMFAQHESALDTSFHQTLTLKNEDVLSARINSLAKGVFQITPLAQSDTTAPLALPLSVLNKIEIRNGSLVWLNDLKPASVSQAPYFGTLMPYQINQSLTGGPLRLIDGTVTKGIAVHSRCVLTYTIDSQFQHFRTKVGFQQPEGKLGRATIRVLGDDKVLWQDADLKGDAAKSTVLDLPVTGVKTLTLEVDYGKNQDTGDRVIWAEPRLIKPTETK